MEFKDQPQRIIAAVGAPEGYTIPCMIVAGIVGLKIAK